MQVTCTVLAAVQLIEDNLCVKLPSGFLEQVRAELGIGQEERVVLLMYGGQPAGAWHLRVQVRSN